MFARALLATAAAIAIAHQASAQAHRRLEIAAALGTYVPMNQLPVGPGNMFAETAICLGHDPLGLCPPGPSLQQKQALAIGGRVTSWLSRRSAIEGTFWYSPSGVTQTYRSAGKIVIADVRFVLSLAPQASTMSVLLLGGPAVIQRFGDAYVDVKGTTSPGGAIGIGLDIHPGHGYSFRAEIGDYLYSVQFASGPGPGGLVGQRKSQHDVVFSLSMSPFGQGGERSGARKTAVGRLRPARRRRQPPAG
jgi:hypothetical protein